MSKRTHRIAGTACCGLLVVLGLCAPAAAQAAAQAASGAVHVLMINGGDQPESNYLSHLQHLQDLVDLLGRRGVPRERIHIFSADGDEAAADLAARETPPQDFWFVDGTAVGNRLKPRTELVDTRWRDVRVQPARLAALSRWFAAARTAIPPGDRLLVFVTDHGTGGGRDPDNAAISLWHERLTVREFKGLLSQLAPGVQVVMVMSQCYSGAFASLMYDDGGGQPGGDVCGFFSTSADQRAYGCYPEGRDRDAIGHAFHFIDALEHRQSLAEAHGDVLASDDTPDRPLRTSDVYLARTVADEATRRGMATEALVETLLGRAWQRQAEYEPEIRLLDSLGEAFGTFSPRSLAELSSQQRELQALAGEMKTAGDKWKTTLGQLKGLLLQKFLNAHKEWRPRLEQKAIDELGGQERALLLLNLLAELGPFAREQGDLLTRLERVQDAVTRSAEAGWRLEARKAAVERMRTVLVGIAGRELLAGEGRMAARRAETAERAPARHALERLQQCEAFAPGRLPSFVVAAPPRSKPPFPPLRADVALLDELQPSWLGATLKPLTPALKGKRKLPPGTALVESVDAGSPADEAGLHAGDFLIGPPEPRVESVQQLNEWVMTAPRDVPLTLLAMRPGAAPADDLSFDALVYLRSIPVERPPVVEPVKAGDVAPALPALTPVRVAEGGADVASRAHLLFFWATWCGPCKRAVPDVLAFAAGRGLPVMAITDEDPKVVTTFLERWKAPFFESVVVDRGRDSFRAFGVSGTPTMLLVDAAGVVRQRQVGYNESLGRILAAWP